MRYIRTCQRAFLNEDITVRTNDSTELGPTNSKQEDGIGKTREPLRSIGLNVKTGHTMLAYMFKMC